MTSPVGPLWLAVLVGGVIAGVAVRVILLPAPDFSTDVDLFVSWVHGIALNGLPNAYDQRLSFPPVMAYLWGLLAAIEPGFRTATDASDTGIRILMKVPPTIADFGLAALVGYALRDRPRWAIVGALAILLHPTVFDVSAWWGQYESIFVLFALAATVFATNGRNAWAAAFIALSLMTKPQALPMIVPFAAWFYATGGWRGLMRAAAIGGTVVLVLWLPFIGAGGPGRYLENLAYYQGERYAALSVWGWNIWWLVQEAVASGNFVPDDLSIVGPLTFRHLGYAIAGVLESLVALALLRDPRPRTLILALVASVLVAFSFLTAMHERYSYGAVIFLALLLPERRALWLSLALGIVVTLNLLTAVPPTAEIHSVLRSTRMLGVLGSIAMLAITGFIYVTLRRRSGQAASP